MRDKNESNWKNGFNTKKLNLDVDSIIRLNVKLVVSWPTECDNKNKT